MIVSKSLENRRPAVYTSNMGRSFLFLASLFLAWPARGGETENMLKRMREGPAAQEPGAGASASTPEELKALYNSKIFPAVRAAVRDYGFDVDRHACNVGAGFTLTAFREFGVTGMTAREGSLHVFNQVASGPAQGWIFDSTIAQFFKERTPPRQAFTRFGFSGTEDDLRKLIADNIEHWDFPDSWPEIDPAVLAAARGRPTADISESDAKQALSGRIQAAQDTFFSTTKTSSGLKDKAEEQDRFHEGAGSGARFSEMKHDQTDRMRRAYKVLDETLAGSR